MERIDELAASGWGGVWWDGENPNFEFKVEWIFSFDTVSPVKLGIFQASTWENELREKSTKWNKINGRVEIHEG
ncbi:hypothetical protein T10_11954 [Trichinella papuae]|uniref:Uncharacterized protein n=1 Tax=Trichinella papuae TaxID=268474 RepID=A0A0V1MYL5_9BILA|nr:hypothetical protein T10_11954 [Trichinella papuae]